MKPLLPLIIVLMVILNFQAIQAQTWTWTDDKGHVRFADDYSQIPEKYRKEAVPGSSKKSAEAFEERKQSSDRIERSHMKTIPKFQIVAQYDRSLSILVPQNTTAEQLRTLIFEFRTARKSNMLSKMIPPTTRGDRLGDYAVVSIFVFSEPDWATSDKLKKFIESKSDADLQFDKEYVKHIKAGYSYVALISSEQGTLGYYDGIVRSPNYEVLWTDELVKKIGVQQREDMGKKMDRVFLNQGMDVEVILEGNMKDILTLKYVLWSRPLVYKFTNGGDMSDGSFLSNLKKAGFKSVNFDNKYDYRVYYDLMK